MWGGDSWRDGRFVPRDLSPLGFNSFDAWVTWPQMAWWDTGREASAVSYISDLIRTGQRFRMFYSRFSFNASKAADSHPCDQGTVHRYNKWYKAVISVDPLPFCLLSERPAVLASYSVCHRISIMFFTFWNHPMPLSANHQQPRHCLINLYVMWLNRQKRISVTTWFALSRPAIPAQFLGRNSSCPWVDSDILYK